MFIEKNGFCDRINYGIGSYIGIIEMGVVKKKTAVINLNRKI